jgi:hypothetical protein
MAVNTYHEDHYPTAALASSPVAVIVVVMRTLLLAVALMGCGTNGSDDVVACGSGWSQLGLEPASVPTECDKACEDPPANLHDPDAAICRVMTPYNTTGSLTLPFFTTSDGRVGACVGGDTASDGPLLFEECYAPYP